MKKRESKEERELRVKRETMKRGEEKMKKRGKRMSDHLQRIK